MYVPTYTFAHAVHVMRNNNISYDTKLGVFVIEQPNEEAKIVTMFPKSKCTCLFSVECFHISAGKNNYRISIKDTHITTVHLTTLRNRNRSKLKENKRLKAVEMPGMYSYSHAYVYTASYCSKCTIMTSCQSTSPR